MTSVLEIVTLVVAGVLTGFELAVAAVLHPQLGRLPDDAYRDARRTTGHRLGRALPYWYALTLVLLIGTALVVPAGQSRALVGVSAAVMVLAVIATIALLVPLNNRIVGYRADQPVAELRELGRLWDRLHWRRVVLLVAMFALLATGVLGTDGGFG